MALPILDTATYELTLPSSDVQVKYRPFLVKEEKILYMALESGDEQQMQSATCLLYTSPSPRDLGKSRMPSSA